MNVQFARMPDNSLFDRVKPLAGFFVYVIGFLLLVSCGNPLVRPDGYQWSAQDTFDINDYVNMVKQTGREFRILQMTDTHIGSDPHEPEVMKRTFNIITDAINDNNPDLLVFTGDNRVVRKLQFPNNNQ
jgi:hypothetical protein